ncbi:hypothetical protein N2152v2_009371 [Parachlorella kessleri]
MAASLLTCGPTATFRGAFSSSRTSRRVVTRCQAQKAEGLDRRQALSAFVAGLAVLATPRSPAFAAEWATFLGQDKPPTSYGGYGGQMIEDAKYVFDYPSNWRSDVVNKIEKGTQGIDCRVYNPRNKLQQAFVITLARAGEDNASFRLVDVDSTLAGFAGADYDLQDVLGDATKTSESREIGGQLYYNIDIDSPSIHYLSSITVKEGKVFALFVKCPANLYATQQDEMRRIVDTFRTT